MTIAADTEVLVSLRGLVDPSKEGARVERELKKAEKDIAAIEKKLALPSFADKAPPEVVARGQEPARGAAPQEGRPRRSARPGGGAGRRDANGKKKQS
jgi:valyl-tRNA synthetase